jgi:hypothetical protein
MPCRRNELDRAKLITMANSQQLLERIKIISLNTNTEGTMTAKNPNDLLSIRNSLYVQNTNISNVKEYKMKSCK